MVEGPAPPPPLTDPRTRLRCAGYSWMALKGAGPAPGGRAGSLSPEVLNGTQRL
jgi:hypothetical protein